jgi:APA family basic amino acid/polyamine antiporter
MTEPRRLDRRDPGDAVWCTVVSGRLLRVLGLGFGIACGIGATIGSGILRAPASVAAELPSPSLIVVVWLGGALYALLGAIAMSEVAALCATSGGFYPIVRRGLGDYAGFFIGWGDVVLGAGSLAALALLIGDHAGVLWPSLAGREGLVALATLVGLAAVQFRGVRAASGAQLVTSALKTVALAALVGACFLFTPRASTAAPLAAPPFPTGLGLAFAVAVALQSVIYTYDGWYSVIYVGGEVRDPARDIPRSLYGSVAAVTLIYLLVNLAFVRVLPVAELAASKQPATAVAQALVGDGAGRVVAALVIVSLLGAINATLLGTPRVLHALASDGYAFAAAARVNAGGTPTVALAATTLLAGLFLLSGTFERVIASLSVLVVVMYSSVFVALFVLRRREPKAPRPMRAPGHPATTGLGLCLSWAFLGATAASAPRAALLTVGLAVASGPAFVLVRRRRDSASIA